MSRLQPLLVYAAKPGATGDEGRRATGEWSAILQIPGRGGWWVGAQDNVMKEEPHERRQQRPGR